MDKKSAIYDKIIELLVLSDLEPNEINIEGIKGYLGLLKMAKTIKEW